MVRAVRDGELDRVAVPDKPLDVLAQQIVAETAAEEEVGLRTRSRPLQRAYPVPQPREATVRRGRRDARARLCHPRGRRAALLHYDCLNSKLARARLAHERHHRTAAPFPRCSTIRVVLEPEGHFVGTLNEDFAIESLPGDVFQLGNTSWRILRIGNGVVRVADRAGPAAVDAVLARRSAGAFATR
jgi:ATP-dependent Lhr-like helicase